MSRLKAGVIGAIAMAALFTVTSASAQTPVTATLHPSGLIEVTTGGVEIAAIDLNAHGPSWQHAPQETATGQIADLSDMSKRVTGTLAIPNTEDGAIEFTETVTALPEGLQIEYEVGVSKTLRLNGLQLSVNLPIAQHGGGEVMILQPHGDPEIAGLPSEPQENRTQLWSGSGATVKVAEGTANAVTIELRAATDVMIQDQRAWEGDVFEVRFPAVMDAAGREVSADDRFHLDLTVTFAGPLSLETQ